MTAQNVTKTYDLGNGFSATWTKSTDAALECMTIRNTDESFRVVLSAGSLNRLRGIFASAISESV